MKKVKWIMLALVLCLGLVGGAYAYWQDDLVVSGTLDTAPFEVIFNLEDPDNLGDLKFYHLGVVITGDDLGGAEKISFGLENENKTLAFEVDGGWPYLVMGSPVTIENNSGIPVKLEAVRIKDNTEAVVYSGSTMADLYGGKLQVVISYWNGSSHGPLSDDHVISAGDTLHAFLTVNMFDVDQDDNYDFKIEMDWVQWNKPATP